MTHIPLIPSRRAFSLMELLVVISIMVILMAMIVPASIGMLNAANVNRASAMVRDELNSARQMALTRGRDIEVRFYEIGSKGKPEDKQFRAFRILLVDTNNPDENESTPLTEVKYFTEPVIVSKDPKFSTILDTGNSERSGLKEDDEPNFTDGTTAAYVSFNFRANGETSLRPVVGDDGVWFLTLHSQHGRKNEETGLPDNYATLQLDPITGRVRTYRP